MSMIDPAIKNRPMRIAVKERADELGARYKVNTYTGKAIFQDEEGQESAESISVILARGNMRQSFEQASFVPNGGKPGPKDM